MRGSRNSEVTLGIAGQGFRIFHRLCAGRQGEGFEQIPKR